MLGRVRIGPRQHVDPVRVVRPRRPDLLPVDHEVVPVAHRARLQRRQIRPRPRLAEPLGPDRLRLRDRRQELLLLRLTPVHHQTRTHHPRPLHVHRHPRQRRLLAIDHLLHVRRAPPAVLRRPGHRQPALIGQRALERARHRVRLVVRRIVRRRRPRSPNEVPHLRAERLVLLAETELHGAPSCPGIPPTRPAGPSGRAPPIGPDAPEKYPARPWARQSAPEPRHRCATLQCAPIEETPVPAPPAAQGHPQ